MLIHVPDTRELPSLSTGVGVLDLFEAMAALQKCHRVLKPLLASRRLWVFPGLPVRPVGITRVSPFLGSIVITRVGTGCQECPCLKIM